MVERDRGDGAGRRRRHHIGCVEAAAETYLDDAEFGRRAGEQQVPRGNQGLEHGDRSAGIHRLDLGKRVGQSVVVHQPASDAEPLAQMHQMRRDRHMHPPACGLPDGAQERARAALAVGARDVDDRRQVQLRVAQLVQQAHDTVQAEVDQLGIQRMQPVDDDAGAPGRRIGGRTGQAGTRAGQAASAGSGIAISGSPE